MVRPHMRWMYSMYQMNLKSSMLMSKFFHLNSGLSLYFSNSSCHSSLVRGGGLPARVQSVMLRPDSVRRVTPPSTTAPTHMPAHPASHQPTVRLTVPEELCNTVLVLVWPPSPSEGCPVYLRCGPDLCSEAGLESGHEGLVARPGEAHTLPHCPRTLALADESESAQHCVF